MTYLIVFLVMALVISPVFWMMPSPRQKRQMALRQRAMSLGLSVQICDLPQTHRARVRQEAPERGVNYLLPWRRKGVKAGAFKYLAVRELESLSDETGAAEVDQLLSKTLAGLPNEVLALEYTSSGVAIYWREKGGAELVDFLHQQLEALCVELSRL